PRRGLRARGHRRLVGLRELRQAVRAARRGGAAHRRCEQGEGGARLGADRALHRAPPDAGGCRPRRRGEEGLTVPLALVTGVTGQDGTYLSRALLAEGAEVHGIVRPGSPASIEPGVIAHEADMRDAEALRALVAEL